MAARNMRSAVPRGVSAKLGFVFLIAGADRADIVCFRVMRTPWFFGCLKQENGDRTQQAPVISTQAGLRWEGPRGEVPRCQESPCSADPAQSRDPEVLVDRISRFRQRSAFGRDVAVR